MREFGPSRFQRLEQSRKAREEMFQKVLLLNSYSLPLEPLEPIDIYTQDPNPLISSLPKPLKVAAAGVNVAVSLALAACGPGVADSKGSNPDQTSKRSAPTIRNPDGILSLPFSSDSTDMRIQQGFFYKDDTVMDRSQAHSGIDFIKGKLDQSKTWQNFPVLAAADGEACFNPPNREGNAVFIKHYNPKTGKNFWTYSGHLSKAEPNIPACETGKTASVKQGKKVAISGATGTANESLPHLHFQVNDESGKPIDPFDIYGKRDQYPTINFSNGKVCGPNALFKECFGPQALIVNPREGATPIPTIPAIAPTITAPKPAPSPTEAAKPGPTPKPFKIGDTVVVTRTSPACLRERVAPGTSANTVKSIDGRDMCHPDGTRFNIRDGSVYRDGYNWWRITGEGWSADQYLEKAEDLKLTERIGRLGSVDLRLADSKSTPFVFNSPSGGSFTLDIPSSWQGTHYSLTNFGTIVNGEVHKNYQTHIVFQFLPQNTFSKLEDLRNYEEVDLNSDLTQFNRYSPRSGIKAVVSKEKVAGQDAYLITGILTNGSALYRSMYSNLTTDVEMSMLVFMVGNQGYRFALLTHPEVTQRELPNFSKMMNSFREGSR